MKAQSLQGTTWYFEILRADFFSRSKGYIATNAPVVTIFEE